MKNILLLTDFSKSANNAITYAMQLFSGETCEFYVLNVQQMSKYITSDLMTSPNKTIHDAIIKNPKKSLDLLVNDLRKNYDKENFSFNGICDYDGFISAVKQVVEIKNIDLIVMGTNGISGIKEAIFGSNTIQIIKKIDLPILVIPENYIFFKPANVLFIAENGMTIDENNMKPLTHIISKFNLQLDVLTIDDETTNGKSMDERDKITHFFKEVTPNFYFKENISIENAIENFIVKNKIQLVSKIINTESFFERIFSESTTANITYTSKVPLLFL